VFAPFNLWTGRTMENYRRFTGLLPDAVATRVLAPIKLITAVTLLVGLAYQARASGRSSHRASHQLLPPSAVGAPGATRPGRTCWIRPLRRSRRSTDRGHHQPLTQPIHPGSKIAVRGQARNRDRVRTIVQPIPSADSPRSGCCVRSPRSAGSNPGETGAMPGRCRSTPRPASRPATAG
jgi:hypothetical protein